MPVEYKKPEASIIVASYKRPRDLRRCLSALRDQSRRSLEILCVARFCDDGTRNVIQEFNGEDPRFIEVTVHTSGVIAALNAGLKRSRGKYIIFTDDDAEAPKNWCDNLLSHFEEHQNCGAVGGRDELQLSEPNLSNPKPCSKVGTITWSGKFHGNHHCPIESDYLLVDVLKGVNMAFRSELIKDCEIGDGLKGEGTQVGWEHSLAHQIKSANKELHFIRKGHIRHYASPRQANDNRCNPHSEFSKHTAYNEGYTIGRYYPRTFGWLALARRLLIGSHLSPGIVRLLSVNHGLSIFRTHSASYFNGFREGKKKQ